MLVTFATTRRDRSLCLNNDAPLLNERNAFEIKKKNCLRHEPLAIWQEPLNVKSNLSTKQYFIYVTHASKASWQLANRFHKSTSLRFKRPEAAFNELRHDRPRIDIQEIISSKTKSLEYLPVNQVNR